MPLLTAGAMPAFGEQPPSGLGEEQYFDELPVVVSVTRLPQTPLELPASMTVLDRRMIEAAGVNDIPELLRLVAGFQIAHVSGSKYAVTYHGMGDDYARRIQVLVDGRSVYMPATSSVDWNDLPLSLEDVERIEVLRGPNGVAFGDNSFSGVVNIITQEAKAARGSYARVQAGQGNYRRAVVRQGAQLGDLDLRVTLEHQSDNGLDNAIKENGNFSSINDGKLSNKMSVRGDWRAGVNDYVQVHAGLNAGSRGFGYNSTTSNTVDYLQEPAFDYRNWRHFEQLKWRHIASSDNELQVQVYHDYTDTQAAYQALAPLPPLSVQLDTLAERYALELEHRFRLNDALRLVWGGELRFDEVTAPGYLNSDEPQQNRMYRLFTQSEWRPATDYLVNLGVMLEHNDIAGTHLSPRAALNYRLAPTHAMRFSATRAYRTPAILEEYADYRATLVGNESVYYQSWKSQGDLQSEKITAYELGWMGSFGGPHNQYDFKLFKEQIRDVISHPLWLGYPSPLPANTLYFFNHDWADLEGAEGQLKSTVYEGTLFSLGYSYVRSRGTMTERLDSNGDILADKVESVSINVPSHTFSWMVEQQFDNNWRGSLAFYHFDHIAFWGETALTTVDVRLARRISHGENEGEVAVVARDITGAYYDFQDERVINPRVYLSVAYRF